VKGDDEYEAYLREEWERFFADPSRAAAARGALDGLTPRRVLDVGCGAGQELYPFVADGTALGIGLDLDPRAGRVARELFVARAPAARITFVQAAAEGLPFADAAFDVVVCRLALPYLHNLRAIEEMARLLRPDGILILKLHAPRFYLRELREALPARRLDVAVHTARVLISGAIYHVTGKQPRNRLLGRETCQTAWRLRRELHRCGLRIVRELPDSNPATPSYVVRHA